MRNEDAGATCVRLAQAGTHTAGAGAPRHHGRSGLLLAATAVLFLSACAARPTPAPPVEFFDYRIGAPDELVVTILPDPAIVEEVVVRPDGMITVQLVGDVRAGGRTAREVAQEIEKRISRFKRGASVTVALAQAASDSITVLGEVRQPQTFALTRQMRVSEALGTAGGVTNFANDDSVRVVRPGQKPQVIAVDMDAIRAGDLRTNVQLYGGDLVYVPPTLLARIGYGVQMVLFPFQPLLGVATSAAGSAIAN